MIKLQHEKHGMTYGRDHREHHNLYDIVTAYYANQHSKVRSMFNQHILCLTLTYSTVSDLLNSKQRKNCGKAGIQTDNNLERKSG
jgi:hypothetical protein